MIADSAVIHSNVKLGANVIVEDFCIIGCEFAGYNGEETVIGDNSVIRSHSVIYAGNVIGSNFQTGNKANIRELNQIGDNVSIGTLSVVEHHVKIESDVRIHTQAFIPEYSVLEKGCWVGPNVVLTNAKYPKSPGVKESLCGPTLRSQCKIGANSVILPGVCIGKSALVGAGSTVTRDVEPSCIVAGSPAKIVRRVHYE